MLLEVSKQRNISVQVLPFERVTPSALGGPMVLLETRDHEHFVLVEGQSMSQLASDPVEVSSLTQRYGMIRMQALSADESAHFIGRMVDEREP